MTNVDQYKALRQKWTKALRVFFALTGLSPEVNHISFYHEAVYIEWSSSKWIKLGYDFLADYDSLKDNHEEILIVETYA
jgi:hypothetical protein